MAGWQTKQLDAIGRSDQLQIAPRRPDGTHRPAVPIWVVRSGDALYVRAYHGPGSSWHSTALQTRAAHIRAGGVDADVMLEPADPQVNDTVDGAYGAKYGRSPYLAPMVRPEARSTTLRLHPA